MEKIIKALNRVEGYLENNDHQGFDPYDTLLSPFPFQMFGKWGPLLAIQFQKRNPINIRPLIGVKKGLNPKAMGLFLSAYSILYKITNEKTYLKKAEFFFNWLQNNYSKGYSGICWGYNFPWASSIKYTDSYVPSSVVTGFVIKGIYEYFKITHNNQAIDIINSSANFIKNDLAWTTDETGICISYTPIVKDVCFNASLLGAEVLAINSILSEDVQTGADAARAVEFVISRQKQNGVWAYSLDQITGKERMQIDFHQGYVLQSIYEIMNHLSIIKESWKCALTKGMDFYYNHQFISDDGRSLWRLPKEYPVDIHNQSQGIITFNKLEKYHPGANEMARKIVEWTIDNMLDKNGYFYYQKFKLYTNKIPYIRWSQAWMFLALVMHLNCNNLLAEGS
jgi:hypothetical protein